MNGGGGFRQAGLPSPLADEVKKFIQENPWLGYKSLSAFVTAGTRKLLQDAHHEVYEKMLLESGRLPPAGHEVRMPDDPRPILVRNGREVDTSSGARFTAHGPR